MATGAADVAEAVTKLPFDHILFTGSTRVGRLVMDAAAINLTPVTLECGGKSPAIIHDGYPLETAARRIAHGKLLNAGQTCIAPDYVLVPAAKVDFFKDAFLAAASALYPDPCNNGDYTSLISDRHFVRIEDMIENAQSMGATAHRLAGDASSLQGTAVGPRRMAPVVLTGVNAGLQVMNEEIFGPVLPVLGYRDIEEAIAFASAMPRPLALYYFDHDKRRASQILARTMSGGVTLNDTLFHVEQETLPFGGIGPSGMGAYHGRDGFLTFSPQRAVFDRLRFMPSDILNPPYGKNFDRLIKGLRWWLSRRL